LESPPFFSLPGFDSGQFEPFSAARHGHIITIGLCSGIWAVLAADATLKNKTLTVLPSVLYTWAPVSCITTSSLVQPKLHSGTDQENGTKISPKLDLGQRMLRERLSQWADYCYGKFHSLNKLYVHHWDYSANYPVRQVLWGMIDFVALAVAPNRNNGGCQLVACRSLEEECKAPNSISGSACVVSLTLLCASQARH
jgi:hypothetical protein